MRYHKKDGTGRTDRIRSYLARSKQPRCLADIVRAIGDTVDQTKFTASTLIRLRAAGEVTRKKSKFGFLYTAA